MAFDFHGVTIIASLTTVNTEGKATTYQLWTEPTGKKWGPPDPPETKALAYVQEVAVVVGMGLNSKVQMTLAPPVEEAIALLNSPLVQWGSGSLNVQVGYSSPGKGNLSPIFGGLVQKPDVKIGRDITITMNALGVAYALNLSNGSDGETFPAGTPPNVAVETVLQRYASDERKLINQFTADDLYPDIPASDRPNHPFFKPIPVPVKKAIETRLTDIDTEIDALNKELERTETTKARKKEIKAQIKALEDEKAALEKAKSQELADIAANYPKGVAQFESIQKGPRNDWWFVFEMCEKYNLELLMIDRNVQIRERGKWNQTAPIMEFVYRGKIDPSAAVPIYPILELSSPTTAMWIHPTVGYMIMRDIDDQGNNSSATASDATTRPGRTGNTAIDPGGDMGPMSGSFPGNPDTSAKDAMIGEYKNIDQAKGIHVEVMTIGIPNLLPGNIVKISGLGPIFSGGDENAGNYAVTEVEHRVGTSGFMTKFKGISNFYPSVVQAVLEAKGQVNNSSPAPNKGDAFSEEAYKLTVTAQTEVA